MRQTVYKIRSGDKWYSGKTGFYDKEETSPIFTNKANVEKQIRTQIRTFEGYEEKGKNYYAKELAEYKAAEIEEYELVRLRKTPAD